MLFFHFVFFEWTHSHCTIISPNTKLCGWDRLRSPELTKLGGHFCSVITSACKGLSRLSHHDFTGTPMMSKCSLLLDKFLEKQTHFSEASSSNMGVSHLWLQQLSAKPVDSNMCRTKTCCIWFLNLSVSRVMSELLPCNQQSWGIKRQLGKEKVKWTN